MHRIMALCVLGACADDGGGGSSATPAETSGTITEAACSPTDNALRFDCDLTLSSAAEVTWQVTSDSGEVVRSFTTEITAVPTLTLWGLPPEEDLTWTASTDGGSATGGLTTGSLPAGLADVAVTVSGVAPELDAVLLPSSCGDFTGLVMVGADGRVHWFEDLDVGAGAGGPNSGITGFDWSPRGTVVAGVMGERVVELWPSGEVVADVSGFDRPLHHDLAADGEGRIWALNAAERDGYVVDGFTVVDSSGELASWDLADHVTPSGSGAASDQFWSQQFPGASDWSHGNSIELGPEGTALLSFRWLDAVVEVVVDPDQPDFGAIEWVLAGTSGGELSSDLVWTDGGGFDGQHHASWTPDGQLALFDNGTTNSRALVVDVDLDAGTVAEVASYSMGQSCRVQGAAYPLADGGMLATCADVGLVEAFAVGAADPSWTLEVACASGGGGASPLTRGLPVTW